MNTPSALLALLLAAGLSTGCGSSEEEVSLDPNALEAVFGEAPAEEPAAESEDQSTTDTFVIEANADKELPVREVAAQAATALRKDDYNEALILMHKLRNASNLTVDQLTAVQNQMSALQGDLIQKAANGDAKAANALKMLQQMSTRL
jgi:hypothetical protein